MSDEKTLRAAQLSDALRNWIGMHQDFGDAEIAAAMSYELAALIAKNAKTLEDAHHLLGHTFHSMREQFRALGVGPQRKQPYP